MSVSQSVNNNGVSPPLVCFLALGMEHLSSLSLSFTSHLLFFTKFSFSFLGFGLVNFPYMQIEERKAHLPENQMNHAHHVHNSHSAKPTGPNSMAASAAAAGRAMETQKALKCPRCDSANTKFCYYNNYSLSQPRHFCKACKRYLCSSIHVYSIDLRR